MGLLQIPGRNQRALGQCRRSPRNVKVWESRELRHLHSCRLALPEQSRWGRFYRVSEAFRPSCGTRARRGKDARVVKCLVVAALLTVLDIAAAENYGGVIWQVWSRVPWIQSRLPTSFSPQCPARLCCPSSEQPQTYP
jgi:hypothetical protein